MDTESFIELLKDTGGSDTTRREKLSEGTPKSGLELCQSDPNFLDCFTKLLTTGESPFEELYHLTFRLGAANSDTSALLSKLWSHYIESLEKTQRSEHLDQLLKSDQVTFFQIVRLLPHTPALLDLDGAFANTWFPQLLHKASGDMAIGPLYDFFEKWFEIDHQQTIKAVKKWNIMASEDTVDLAARALGTLRDSAQETVRPLSEEYQQSRRPDDRTIYLRSWHTTIIRSLPSSKTIGDVLDDIDTSLPHERREGLRIVCALFSLKVNAKSISLASRWLQTLNGSSFDATERYLVADSLARAWRNDSKAFSPKNLLPLNNLLIEIQPVAEEHKGTWARMAEVAIAVHRSDKDQFQSLCRELFESNPTALQNLFSTRDGYVGDEGTDISSTLAESITEYVFSPNRVSRQYGFQLMKLCQGYELPEDELLSMSEEAIAIAIFETRICYMEGAGKMRFLLALLSRIETASDDLQTAYSDELFYQGCNLPGENTPLLKEAAANSHLAAAVLQRVDSYFGALSEANQSPIDKMEVPGYTLAKRVVIRRQARQMNEAMKSASSFLQFFKSSTIIYGSEGFQSYFNGALAQPTSFSRSSSSVEFPRLDISNSDDLRIQHAMLSKHQDLLAASITRKEDKAG